MASTSVSGYGTIALNYLGTTAGLKNLVCKPSAIYADAVALVGSSSGDVFTAIAKDLGSAKGIIGVLDAVTKFKPLTQISRADFKDGMRFRGRIAEIADWTISAWDLVDYCVKSKVFELAATAFYRGRVVASGASVVFAVLNLWAESKRWDTATKTGQLVRLDKDARECKDVDYTAMKISIAVNVGFLAFFCFNLPLLIAEGLGLAIAAHIVTALKVGKICSFTLSTVSIVAKHFWEKRCIEPLDTEYLSRKSNV